MRTFMANESNIERKWYVVDAADLPVGRVAAPVAAVLRGKHKPTYTPHVDTGDYVIVVNADKAIFTGNKETDKFYHHHSDHPGGLTSINAATMREKHPERLIEIAVKGMLPKNSLGRKMGKKLFVYAGPEHKHAAQQPEVLDINTII